MSEVNEVCTGEPLILRLLDEFADVAATLSDEEKKARIQTLVGHLAICEPCQDALSDYLRGMTARAAVGSVQWSTSQGLLLRHLRVAMLTRVRKQLPAYAELRRAQGEEAAGERYPDVAQHIATCTVCRGKVEALLA